MASAASEFFSDHSICNITIIRKAGAIPCGSISSATCICIQVNADEKSGASTVGVFYSAGKAFNARRICRKWPPTGLGYFPCVVLYFPVADIHAPVICGVVSSRSCAVDVGVCSPCTFLSFLPASGLAITYKRNADAYWRHRLREVMYTQHQSIHSGKLGLPRPNWLIVQYKARP